MTLSPQDAALAYGLVTKGKTDREIARILDVSIATVRQHYRTSLAQGHNGPLTPRQRQVAGLWVQGDTEEAIADALGLSPNTVHKHIQNIYLRLGVHTRADVAVLLNGKKEVTL